MDLWIWIIAAAAAAVLISLIDPIVKYFVVFRRRKPKGGVLMEKYLEKTGGWIPGAQALVMLEPVVRRLALFHTNGRVHLDLCPQRIVVVPGQQKMALLGPGRSGNIRPGYSAPEQYGGKTGLWTDVYAVAAVFYRMAVGKNPPEAAQRIENDTEVAQAVAGMDVADEIKQALLRALNLEPKARFQDCGMLAQDLYPHSKPPAEQVNLKRK